MSLLQIPYSVLVQFVHSSVSGGYVVALGVICLLQYVLHVHQMNRERRERAQCHRDKSGVEIELHAARRDRTLTTHENRVLREFLSEPECDRAIERLLRSFTAIGGAGWAACLAAWSAP